jgi:predicted transcriptional regulator
MYKGKLGGIAKGKAYNYKKNRALELRRQGFKQHQMALELGVSDRTIRNWLKSGK